MVWGHWRFPAFPQRPAPPPPPPASRSGMMLGRGVIWRTPCLISFSVKVPGVFRESSRAEKKTLPGKAFFSHYIWPILPRDPLVPGAPDRRFSALARVPAIDGGGGGWVRTRGFRWKRPESRPARSFPSDGTDYACYPEIARGTAGPGPTRGFQPNQISLFICLTTRQRSPTNLIFINFPGKKNLCLPRKKCKQLWPR